MTTEEELSEAHDKLHTAESSLARHQAILYYIGECQAATTEGYNRRKSSPKSEVRRHKSICEIISNSIQAERLVGSMYQRGSISDLKTSVLKRLKEATEEPQ